MKKSDIRVASFGQGFLLGLKDQDALIITFQDDKVPRDITHRNQKSVSDWSHMDLESAMDNSYPPGPSKVLLTWYQQHINTFEEE